MYLRKAARLYGELTSAGDFIFPGPRIPIQFEKIIDVKCFQLPPIGHPDRPPLEEETQPVSSRASGTRAARVNDDWRCERLMTATQIIETLVAIGRIKETVKKRKLRKDWQLYDDPFVREFFIEPFPAETVLSNWNKPFVLKEGDSYVEWHRRPGCCSVKQIGALCLCLECKWALMFAIKGGGITAPQVLFPHP